jgi:ABC-type polysaccharide/polyol phosphate transport system ATPase subunit
MTALLKFDDVTIQYPVYNNRNTSLRNQLIRISTGGRIESAAGHVQLVTALRNVTFTINHGDSVGLVGHNGAGKSTLLRTMAGVYTPMVGKVTRQGHVATVLELGTGMDPELSGYENIVRISMLLGMSGEQIRKSVKDVECFTQLGDFLQLPVRTYSAGMVTRLMFAVATANRPDILLVDEMFETGDAEFQVQAKKRLEEIIRSVGIFVFASHSSDLIKTYCNRFFLLEHGLAKEVSRDEIDGLTSCLTT